MNQVLSSTIRFFKKKNFLNLLFIILFISSLFSLVIIIILDNLTHDFFINIYSDKDIEKYAKIGSGTLEDPYIIENITISTDEAYGIYISSITKALVIRVINDMELKFSIHQKLKL